MINYYNFSNKLKINNQTTIIVKILIIVTTHYYYVIKLVSFTLIIIIYHYNNYTIKYKCNSKYMYIGKFNRNIFLFIFLSKPNSL